LTISNFNKKIRGVGKMSFKTNTEKARALLVKEVAIDDFEKNRVLQLKKNSYEWYAGKAGGATIRHTKVLFKTHNLQRQICKEYRYHDPTKNRTGCIEVLLCKPNIKGYEDKWVAISTVRKLKPECLIKHPETYASVPNEVLDTAARKLNLSQTVKEAVKATKKLIIEKLKKDPELRKKIIRKRLKDKPVLVTNKKEFIKKVILKE
jgi:hypothetical protein